MLTLTSFVFVIELSRDARLIKYPLKENGYFNNLMADIFGVRCNGMFEVASFTLTSEYPLFSVQARQSFEHGDHGIRGQM